MKLSLQFQENKNDFEIEIEDGLLSISSSFNKEQKEDNSKLTRIEFDYNSFKRTFSIPESVDSSRLKQHTRRYIKD